MAFSLEKPNAFYDKFERKGGNLETTHYCPGCGHGIVHKLLAETMDELGIQDRTIMVDAIGCSVFKYYYFEASSVSVGHGRAPAAGTAISRAHSDAITISYQGDGDLSSIGMSHIIHAANRGENLIVIFINNNNYGMTGGQIAPTTLIGQKTTTSPFGRNPLNEGYPIHMSELIANLQAPVLSARTAVNTPPHIRETKRLLQRGLQAQCDKKGFVLIEILSPCPTNWHKTPVEACQWIENEVIKTYPLGIWKDEIDSREPQIRTRRTPNYQECVNMLGIQAPDLFSDQSWAYTGKELRIKVAGFGGQGVLSLGLALANMNMRKGREVTWLPSYGPEMRGGVANCSIVVSDKPIGSPVVERPDILVAMNQPSLAKFGPLVPEEGTIFYNKTMVDQVPEGLVARLCPLDATDIAIQAGNIKAANMVFLAFIANVMKLFSWKEIEQYLTDQFKKDTVRELNKVAAQSGWNATV